MAGIIDGWNQVLSHFKSKTSPYVRVSTPIQLDVTEVDEPGHSDYRFEESRLRSFVNWPSSCVSPTDLAAAGFFYVGQTDRVRCFECRTEICNWEEGDQPMSEHQRWAGRCRFVRKLPCGNVPLGADPSAIPPRSYDFCGHYGLDYRFDAEADAHGQHKLPSAARLACLGISLSKKPDYPDYTSYEARLKSFKNWPAAMIQTKEQLADAGFFYTGTGDHTTCYHCGGGLKKWEPFDDPWVQHAKWFSSCAYVRLVKGQEFINNVTGKHTPLLSEEETMQWNLPSCIKKVEALAIRCSEEKTEAQENVPQSHLSESSSKSERLSPRSEALQIKTSDETLFTNSTGAKLEHDVKSRSDREKSIEDGRVCKFCYDEELGIVFLPCGHLVACVKCASGMTTCAVCRKEVKMTVRAFLS
ncbi:hypothetical protein QAD02_008516 [Eretmocerus hayati]|uniref:Uncharacterized protein n=1 Tax=Eretmocerus hayati TaxID=131215 RepID=A0ACC2N726_9HYME|nr:hypothetical protein QAD02_008516 [Eretmocerus hayati]